MNINMTAERLADNYARILLSGVRIRRIRISFCPSSSSATPNTGPNLHGGRWMEWRKSELLRRVAARGWLQRLVSRIICIHRRQQVSH